MRRRCIVKTKNVDNQDSLFFYSVSLKLFNPPRVQRRCFVLFFCCNIFLVFSFAFPRSFRVPREEFLYVSLCLLWRWMSFFISTVMWKGGLERCCRCLKLVLYWEIIVCCSFFFDFCNKFVRNPFKVLQSSTTTFYNSTRQLYSISILNILFHLHNHRK